jgi:hypothetical protein
MLETNKNDYYYGMKRYFDIGCQPSGQKGLVSPELLSAINTEVNPNIKFMDVVRYEEELSIEDIAKYELKPLKNITAIQGN